jgi:outer membrane lipoprotein-sorting protein
MDITVGATGITYKNLGTEACGNLTCYKYQVTTATAAGAKQYVWFDTTSYQLRRWQYSDSSTGTTDMAISYQPVTISQPSPVQPLSATGQ